MNVVIVGQGYVGLPLAIAAAAAGHHVIGFDHDPTRVDRLNAGQSPIDDIGDDELAAAVAAGSYSASADPKVICDAEVVVVCVPTPYHNDEPDLSHVEDAARKVGEHLQAGTVVILESTTYPGTTEELLVPALEQASGMVGGTDFHVVFSPERIDPGNPTYGLHNTPKIVGGVTDEATRRAIEFYGSFVETVVPVSGPKAAEMAKLLENTFRHINIALVNELAVLCHDMDIDVWEVIDAAASKPFGFVPFYPGPGVGGHCIPVDPMYLSWRVRQFGGSAKFIELARDVNNAMPLYCASRVQDLLNDRNKPLKGARLLLIGVAYKPNIADVRESPALPLIDALLARGAEVEYHDAHVPSIRLDDGSTLAGVELTDAHISDADCVVLVTNHDDVDYERIVALASLVFDTRNTIGAHHPNVVRL